MPDLPVTAIVEGVGIVKQFDGARALNCVDFAIQPGTVHALVGENGAGKSTLGKVIAGLLAPSEGQLLVDGHGVRFNSPRDAIARGLTIVEQEGCIVSTRSVLENVYLGLERAKFGFVSIRALRKRYQRLCEQAGYFISPDLLAGTLTVADQQKVEILRALAREARLIVMDEPTASLSRSEAEQLGRTIRRLRDGGTTIVYVSHFLEDVLSVSDTVTVLRDGAVIETSPCEGKQPQDLVRAMLGRSLEMSFPPKVPPPSDSPVAFRAHRLHRGPLCRDVSFEVHRGEIVGLAGLVGSGRTEIARAIFGADGSVSGTVEVGGESVHIGSPRRAKRVGIAYVPESRRLGLHVHRSIADNVSMAFLARLSRCGFVSRNLVTDAVGRAGNEVGVPVARARQPVAGLSGGNQQRVMLAKWLVREPRLLILDEPTQGVDVGAKFAVHQVIAALAAKGIAIVVISSQVEEVIGLAHRILVVSRGRVAAELPGDASEESIMNAALLSEPTEMSA